MSGPISETSQLHHPAGYQFSVLVQASSGIRFWWTAWLLH